MIDNFKELLYAIFNSDSSERKVKSVICIYDTLDCDRLVAVFSTSQLCADFFGTDRRVIDCDICRGVLKKDRFRLERVKVED